VTGTHTAGADFSGTLFQGSDGSAGNYVKFLNCTGSSLSLEPVHAGSSDKSSPRTDQRHADRGAPVRRGLQKEPPLHSLLREPLFPGRNQREHGSVFDARMTIPG